MALFAKIVSFPPLSNVTIVPANRQQITFTVILESSTSLPEQPWEVSVWYDHGGYTGTKPAWHALDLTKQDDDHPTILHEVASEKVYRNVFSGSLPTPYPETDRIYKGRRVPFTFRYRINSDAPWGWVRDNFGLSDGELILQPPVDPNFLGASPIELKEGWIARKLNSEAPEARLYGIESQQTIPPEEGDSTFQHKVLGRVTQTCRWFALVRIWSPWLAPRHGPHHFHITEDAILLSFLRTDGLHVAVLAVNGIDEALTVFKSNDDGDIVVATSNDTTKDRKFRLLAATAWTFEIAISAVMYEARKLVQSSAAYEATVESLQELSVQSGIAQGSNAQKSAESGVAKAQWVESWHDSLAYCTWNSLGQDLNAQKIMNGLQSLAENKIYIATLIIDDNWQSLTGVQGETSQSDRGWKRFEANADGFPEGLKAAVTKIREAHPHIRDIAVWHALFGYWGMIAPDGELAQTYKPRTVELNSSRMGGTVTKTAIDPSDIHRMYDDFYTFLSSCGITGVKTDAQMYLDLLKTTHDRRDIMTTYQSAWTQAQLKHLGGKAISCMSMIPQVLHHQFLPNNTPRIMLRTSDDFFPNVETSHPWHIFVNAHNAVYVQHLNVLPDWDMFQTSHAYSGFHAAARCISGGPIYITDYPGEHNVELIQEMTARSPRANESIILRPSTIGKSIDVYNRYDEKGILRVGAYDGRAEVGSSMLGLFNLAPNDASFCLPIFKFPGLNFSDSNISKKWIVRSHMSRRITKPITPRIPTKPGTLLQASLPQRGYDIWSAIPVHDQSLGDKPIGVAVLGLLGKLTGACAIIESKIERSGGDTQRIQVHVALKALGKLGVWISDGHQRRVEDLMVMLKGQVVPPETVTIETEGCDGDEAGVVVVDVEKAWDSLGIESGYSNEVPVDVYLP